MQIFPVNKVKDLVAIPGEIGLTVKVGLYSGLRQEEIIYLHNTDICNNLSGCSCNKLHVVKKPNGLTVIIMNLFRGHKKCYFTILPTLIFEQFRKIPNFDKGALDLAHKLTKRIMNVKFVDGDKLNLSVEDNKRFRDLHERFIECRDSKRITITSLKPLTLLWCEDNNHQNQSLTTDSNDPNDLTDQPSGTLI